MCWQMIYGIQRDIAQVSAISEWPIYAHPSRNKQNVDGLENIYGHFPNNIFKCIFLNWFVVIWLISLKFIQLLIACSYINLAPNRRWWSYSVTQIFVSSRHHVTDRKWETDRERGNRECARGTRNGKHRPTIVPSVLDTWPWPTRQKTDWH